MPRMAPSMGAMSAILFPCPHVVVGLWSVGLADVGVLLVHGRAHARLDRLPAGAGQRVASVARIFDGVRTVRAGKVLAGDLVSCRRLQLSHRSRPGRL